MYSALILVIRFAAGYVPLLLAYLLYYWRRWCIQVMACCTACTGEYRFEVVHHRRMAMLFAINASGTALRLTRTLLQYRNSIHDAAAAWSLFYA